MREINYIVLHTSATPQSSSVESIKRYWKETLHWSLPGYHYIITASGELHKLLDESRASNGVKGYNAKSINVCYIGGVDAQNRPIDNRTPLQKCALWDLLVSLKSTYPNAKIMGHRDFPNVAKACPCFDAAKEYKKL